MKKIFLSLVFLIFAPVFAFGRTITLGEFLDQYTAIKKPAASYKYIKLNYKNIEPLTYEHIVMQKAVYLDLMPNKHINFPFKAKMSEKMAVSLLEKFEWISLEATDAALSQEVLDIMLSFIKWTSAKNVEVSLNREYDIAKNREFAILNDVYEKLTKLHYDKDELVKSKLLHGAVKGMAQATDDEYTAYFPPVESKTFTESLQGEFVGIGAYVDMPQPGKFIITAPIEGSPAEKAWIKGGDQVIQVDDFVITEEHGTQTIIQHIKGERGTKVTLTIIRDGKTLEIDVIRDLIIIESVEEKKLDAGTAYIDINQFSDGIYYKFATILEEANIENKNKIIIDLTDNPGGSLQDVVMMLDHFVPKGKPSVVTRDLNNEEVILSEWAESKYYLGNKKVIFMINNGSASASEILAGTAKEYNPQAIIVGEQSFGKGSVQSLVEYFDNSLLKITTAKWFTGKDKVSIDDVGITPDIIVEDDPETEKDEILEKAKTL